MPKPALLEFTMSAAAGYDAQPIMVVAANISAIHRHRVRTGRDVIEIEVRGTYICTGTHDFIVDEDFDTVVSRVNAALGE